MALSIYQKSVYITLFNSTMIGRSVGKSFKKINKSFKNFQLAVLKESQGLIKQLEDNKLSEKNILASLDKLVRNFGVSYGQAQKGINVILKYHYQLYKKHKNFNGKILHCPLDSIILKELKIRNLSLSGLNKKEYLLIQEKIAKLSKIRIDFDEFYEKDFLRRIGWL